MRTIGSLVALVAVGCSFGVTASEPNPDAFISRAVYAENKLWVLSDNGNLSTIDPRSLNRTTITFSSPILDLAKQNDRPLVIRCETSKCDTWLAHEWKNGQWRPIATVPTNGDRFWGLEVNDKEVLVLTSAHLIAVNKITNVVRLAHRLPSSPFGGRLTSILSVGDLVFAGFNGGEWGGELDRIDRQTGNVLKIGDAPRKLTPSLPTSVPLPTNAPSHIPGDVNGMASEPWNANCIVVADGLIHFMPSGDIIEICGNTIHMLYRKQFGDRPFMSVAFFGIAAKGDHLWAAGMDGLYRISKDGSVEEEPFPHLIDAGGIEVSFQNPNFVLVATDINRRHAMSGSTPMLVAR